MLSHTVGEKTATAAVKRIAAFNAKFTSPLAKVTNESFEIRIQKRSQACFNGRSDAIMTYHP